MNKLGTKLGAIAMSAVMALSFAPSAAITSLAASGDDLLDATFGVEPVYRLYNPNSGEHLFTTDVLERDSLVKENWDNEGAKWNAPSVSAEGIYRLYNPSTGEHLYTSDGLEIAHLVNDEKWEEDFGGYPAFYAADDDLDPDAITINRFFNPAGTGVSAHIFSADPAEIKALTDKGYEKENGFGGYPLDYEPEEPVEELTVSIDNPTPKVGDTLTATVDPADAKVKYEWFAYDAAESVTGTSIGKEASFKVTTAQVGKYIGVTVTDAAGNTYSSTKSNAVMSDASADVSLVDDYGLQADGTGIVGDRLRVSYGATFGVPTNITWYRDGAVLDTASVGDVVAGALVRVIQPTDGTGTYYVTITNTEGKVSKSNEIIITDKEEPATIKSFAIEDDYTDGTDVDFQTNDNRAVAVVTLSKNYAGTFRIYKATDTSYGAPLTGDTLTIDNVVRNRTAAQATSNSDAAGAIADGTGILCTTAATNYQVLNTSTAASFGSGYGVINNDGTATYRWVLDDTGVARGSEYVVTFDQTSISSDTPGTGKANVSEKAAAPYVKAISKIAVTKVSNGNNPEIKLYNKDGEVMGDIGYTAAAAGNAQLSGMGLTDQNGLAGATTDLDDIGVASAQVYKSTNKTTDPSASGVSAIAAGTTNRDGDSVLKGVWTVGAQADKTAYYFAQIKTDKGVYGADSLTVTSEAVQTAQDSATDMDLTQNKDTATTATVSFSNLRASGTVYIVRGSFSTSAVDTVVPASDRRTVANMYNKFKATDPSTYAVSAKVEAGTAKLNIENAIGATTGYTSASTGDGATPVKDYNTDQYIAIFIPDDEVNYGTIYTDGTEDTGGDSMAVNWTGATETTRKALKDGDYMSGLYVKSVTKKYELNGFLGKNSLTTITAGGGNKIIGGAFVTTAAANYDAAKTYQDCIIIKDQFGNTIGHDSTTAGLADVKWTFKKTSSEGAQDGTLVLDWDIDGATDNPSAGKTYDALKLTSTIGASNANFAKGDTYTATTSTGQTLTLTCTKASTAGTAGAETVSEWKLTIS